MSWSTSRGVIVLLASLTACTAKQGSLTRLSPQDPRYVALVNCAQTIGVAEGFHPSASSGTLFERQVGDISAQVKELLWLGSEFVGDSVRAVAHVQRTSSSRRTTIDQLSPASQRVVQRINSECAVARSGALEGSR